jgi:ligand-binding SRPBCC domain-containing protein
MPAETTSQFSISIDITAPPGRVWKVMSEVERWAEWTPSVTSIVRLDDGPLGVGKRLLIRQPKLPRAIWKITELDEGRSFTSVTRSPAVTVTARHSVEATANGSRATLSIRFSGLFGALTARLTRNLNERYLGLEARGLKARSESNS